MGHNPVACWLRCCSRRLYDRGNSENVKPIAKMICLLGFLHVGPMAFFPGSMYLSSMSQGRTVLSQLTNILIRTWPRLRFSVNVPLTSWDRRSSSAGREPSLLDCSWSCLHSRRGRFHPIEAGSSSREGGDSCELRLKEREPRRHQILKSIRATRRQRENGDCAISSHAHGRPRRA